MIRYCLQSFRLSRRLRLFFRSLERLQGEGTDPFGIKPADKHLRHLWTQYCLTLHAERTENEDGLEIASRHRATVPASAIFHAGSIVDSQLSVEFFKHLPGLLTGLGIIGTFLGLITGLQQANSGGGLDTQALIGSVREAFFFSAGAIISAMLVTFLEKWRYARLIHLTDELCHTIDRLFSAGVGEEYLRRLVIASEQAVTNSQQLRDSLVGDLTNILERLTERQIAAASHHSTELSASLQQPIKNIADSVRELKDSQTQAIGTGLQGQMDAFVAKLDELLGGQVGQARDLQAETANALRTAVSAFQNMAQSMTAAGDKATGNMSEQLRLAIGEVATHQAQINESMLLFLEEMRSTTERSQSDTQRHLGGMLQRLSTQMSGTIDGLQKQTDAAAGAALAHQQQISEEARRAVENLAEEVRNQTAVIEQATLAMRGAVADLSASTTRNIQTIGDGAQKMTAAAGEFARTGHGLKEMIQNASAIMGQMTQSADVLGGASTHVREIVADYRAARGDLQTTLATLRDTVADVQRHASMTGPAMDKIGQAAEKLRHAQDSAEEYLDKLNGVLANAHEVFSAHLQNTLKQANLTFHQELTRATQIIADGVGALDDALSHIAPRTH